MAQTRFSGPVVSDNGFVGNISGNITATTITATGAISGATLLGGTVTTPGTLAVGGNASLLGAANVIKVPTVDPGVAGALWNDDGTLKVSSGA
jgi:hypothetical protein